ncbi:MAG: hypothetical protein IIC73_04940 [Armatimonadetes bacterium]|nr:hypothetical protein [Armatimonadota bacterium]
MNNRTNGWTAAILAVALCALVLVFATPGATAQSNNGGANGLAHRLAALEATVGAQQATIDQLTADLAAETGARASGDVATLAAANAYTDGQVAGLTSRVFAVENKTQFMSVLGTTTRFSGTNVQVVNGRGGTHLINGLGNLIVGYNETNAGFGEERGGSHNIVVGILHDYLSYGGLVAGLANRIASQHASVTGGGFNVASGAFSTVTAGERNIASGFRSAVTGGIRNTASHLYSTVSGGANQSTTSSSQWIGGTFRSPP